jgi:hypothetical protein
VPQNRSFVAKTEYHWFCRSCRFSNYWLFSVSKFVAEPKQLEAADEMFVAQENFQQATTVLQAIHYIIIFKWF